MDHSVCNMKAILAVAVLAMAAFAGVMMVGDDADATVNDELGDYSVTYSFNGSSIMKKMDSNNEFKFGAAATVGLTAPTGYGFEDKWKDVKSGAIYTVGQSYSFTSNITVEPVLKVSSNYQIVILTDGVVSEKFALNQEVVVGTHPAADVITPDMVKKFLETAGVKGAIAADGKIAIEKAGYRFDGFVKVVDPMPDVPTYVDSVANLTGTPGAEVTYMLTFTPVYNVSFIVEGASVLEITSDKVILNSDKDAGLTRSIPGAPTKENYIFMGWYNAAGEKVIGYSSDKNEYTYSIEDFKFTENTTLYAKFVPVTFTVTFVYGEDRAVFATETVKYGDLAIEPKGLPEGYKGWDWNFGVPIEADTEIPAIEADPVTVYTVTFEIDGKAPVTQRSDSMVLPDTAIEGKVFQGWVVKGESQYVSPMNYAITGDITFVAVYKEADPPAGPSFFQTTEGKCVAVLIAVVIIAFIYAVYTNMFGLKDALTSVKITRVKK